MLAVVSYICLDQSEASIERSDQSEARLIWVTCVMSQSKEAAHADNTWWQKKEKYEEQNIKSMEKQNHNSHNNNTNNSKGASLDAKDEDIGI